MDALIRRVALGGAVAGLPSGLLVGGGARSEAVRQIAPAVLGCPVVVPEPGEYVADGAARQAAWVLSGEDEPPRWDSARTQTFEADVVPEIGRAHV